MADGEIQYSFRTRAPDVLERERAQVLRMPAYRDGALAAPTVAGSSFTLLDPSGTAVVDGKAITVVSDIAQVALTAGDLPDTLDLSDMYQERWVLVMPDGTTRTVRREAAVARFLLTCPVADPDIVNGEYPDLVNELGDFATSLQGFIDEAWAQLLNKLWNRGRWPEMLVSQSSIREPIRQKTMALIFKFLYRQTSGNNRFLDLMNRHESEWEKAFNEMTSRLDTDMDGRADDRNRVGHGGMVHRNVNWTRILPKSNRW